MVRPAWAEMSANNNNVFFNVYLLHIHIFTVEWIKQSPN